MIKYNRALDIKTQAEKIIDGLFPHVKIDHVVYVRSKGTKSRRTVARCHALGKIMQLALERQALYVLEFISERFDKLSEEDQIKVIIHELMHIPKSFGGGFRHHDFVTNKNIEELYKKFIDLNSKNMD